MHLSSSHADRQSVDILFTVCLFAMIKLAASNFARWFIDVLGREYPILWNFAPSEAQNQTNRPSTRK